MTITATFESFEEMMEFAEGMAGRTQTERKAEDNSRQDTVQQAAPAKTVPTVPVTQPTASTPVQPTASVAQPTVPVAQPTAPVAPVAQPTAPASAVPVPPASAVPVPPAAPAAAVPTSGPAYTLDDLARAAMTLMDSGRQLDLQKLLAQFGCEALPALPQSQYGAFATALRGMGAQI